MSLPGSQSGDTVSPDSPRHRQRRFVLIALLLAIVGLGASGAVLVLDAVDHDAHAATPRPDRPPQDAPPTAAPSPGPSTPRDKDFSKVFRHVKSGVVHIRTTTCDESRVGSGFLIADDRVATAAHMVDEAVAVAVQKGAKTISARVTRIDTRHDLAILDFDGRISGHIFALAADDPSPGTRVAAIGYPLGEPLSIAVGSVSGLHRNIWTDETGSIEGLLQTDVALNPGNSGGPLVDLDEQVVGVVSAKRTDAQGISYAVEASTATPRLSNPARMRRPTVAKCELPLDPGDPGADSFPEDSLPGPVARTFATYFDGINTGNYEAAWSQFSARHQRRAPFDQFSHGVSTSHDFAFAVRLKTISTSRAEVWLKFRSVQDPEFGPDGEGCTVWSLDYVLITDASGRYRIDQARGHSRPEGHTPCS